MVNEFGSEPEVLNLLIHHLLSFHCTIVRILFFYFLFVCFFPFGTAVEFCGLVIKIPVCDYI